MQYYVGYECGETVAAKEGNQDETSQRCRNTDHAILYQYNYHGISFILLDREEYQIIFFPRKELFPLMRAQHVLN